MNDKELEEIRRYFSYDPNDTPKSHTRKLLAGVDRLKKTEAHLRADREHQLDTIKHLGDQNAALRHRLLFPERTGQACGPWHCTCIPKLVCTCEGTRVRCNRCKGTGFELGDFCESCGGHGWLKHDPDPEEPRMVQNAKGEKFYFCPVHPDTLKKLMQPTTQDRLDHHSRRLVNLEKKVRHADETVKTRAARELRKHSRKCADKLDRCAWERLTGAKPTTEDRLDRLEELNNAGVHVPLERIEQLERQVDCLVAWTKTKKGK